MRGCLVKRRRSDHPGDYQINLSVATRTKEMLPKAVPPQMYSHNAPAQEIVGGWEAPTQGLTFVGYIRGRDNTYS